MISALLVFGTLVVAEGASGCSAKVVQKKGGNICSWFRLSGLDASAKMTFKYTRIDMDNGPSGATTIDTTAAYANPNWAPNQCYRQFGEGIYRVTGNGQEMGHCLPLFNGNQFKKGCCNHDGGCQEMTCSGIQDRALSSLVSAGQLELKLWQCDAALDCTVDGERVSQVVEISVDSDSECAAVSGTDCNVLAEFPEPPTTATTTTATTTATTTTATTTTQLLFVSEAPRPSTLAAAIFGVMGLAWIV